MKTFTLHQAKTHLSRLVRDALRGETVIIARGRQPVVRLTPLDEAIEPRRFGTAAGQIVLDNTFDEPLEDFVEYR